MSREKIKGICWCCAKKTYVFDPFEWYCGKWSRLRRKLLFWKRRTIGICLKCFIKTHSICILYPRKLNDAI